MGALVSAMLVVGAVAGPQLSCTNYGTCAVWHEEVKCWGDKQRMDPSYFDGGGGGWITSPPEPFDLGDNFIPSQVMTRYGGACAVSVDGRARCWGNYRSYGFGYENTLLFSDPENFGRDISLADGFVIESGSCGADFCCVLSTDHLVQCWGYCVVQKSISIFWWFLLVIE